MIYKIKNTFIRRLITLIVLPIVIVVGSLIILPAAAVLDYLIALIKCTIKVPVRLYEVEKEMLGVIEQAFKDGWYGSKT